MADDLAARTPAQARCAVLPLAAPLAASAVLGSAGQRQSALLAFPATFAGLMC